MAEPLEPPAGIFKDQKKLGTLSTLMGGAGILPA